MLHLTLAQKVLKCLVALEHMVLINQLVDLIIEQAKVEITAELLMDLNQELMEQQEHLDHHMVQVEIHMPKEPLMDHHQEQEAEVELEVELVMDNQVHRTPELMVQQELVEELYLEEEHHQDLGILYQVQVLGVMEHQVQDIMEEIRND